LDVEVIRLAILVAAAAAWLTGNWLKTRFLEIALCVAFILLLWLMVAKTQCGQEGCWATIVVAMRGTIVAAIVAMRGIWH
jgi:uncharacterized membrane protein